MFNDDDEEEDDFVMEGYQLWLEENKMVLPIGYLNSDEGDLRNRNFYYNVYRKVMKELTPALRQLMDDEYRLFSKEVRPRILVELNRIAGLFGQNLLLDAYNLLYIEEIGLNLRDIHPDFEQMKAKFASQGKPHFLDDSIFDQFPWKSEEQRQDAEREHRERVQKEFDEEQELRKEFYDVVQPILFKYYGELLDMEPDSWVLYASYMDREYDDYNEECDAMYYFIYYGFTEADLDLPDSEYFVLLNQRREEHMRQLDERND